MTLSGEREVRESTAKEIIRKRVEAKTRRFVSPAKPSPGMVWYFVFFWPWNDLSIYPNQRHYESYHRKNIETQANKFIPVAGLFFFPLLAKYDRSDPTFDLVVCAFVWLWFIRHSYIRCKWRLNIFSSTFICFACIALYCNNIIVLIWFCMALYV